MNYHHLTIEERRCIRKYYVDGLSYREIARLIGRNVDVYKRQDLPFAAVELHDASRLDGLVEKGLLPAGLEVLSSSDAVSYTHLDVYKRQGLRRAGPSGP